MSLATRCPYCSTTFRVTHDQLKLRGGLVRCGSCKEIFNGVEHLLPAAATTAANPAPDPASPPGEATLAPAPPIVPPPSPSLVRTEEAPPPNPDESSHPAGPAPDSTADADRGPAAPEPFAVAQQAPHTTDSHDRSGPEQTDEAAPAAALAGPQPVADASSAAEEAPDPLTRMTLMDIRPDPYRQQDQTPPNFGPERAPSQEADEISRAIDDLQSKPWRAADTSDKVSNDPIDALDALDNDEPAFVRRARSQQAAASKRRAWILSGSVLLALLAVLQAAIAFRTPIAAQWPATMPALTQLCSAFGCTVDMPMQIEFITIESHELQAMPASDNTFTLGMLLRNRSAVTQAWPHLQLTLNDPAGEPVARRVLTPAQYLRPSDRERGFAAKSEKPVRVSFALDQLTASGYLLYAFYP